MTEILTFRARNVEEPAAWQDWDARENGAGGHELDGDCMPVLADQFRITDLQHWLDLCA
jgi:hypothetical protein